MANFQEARVKLTNTELNKLQSATKSNTETIIILNEKNLKMRNCHMNHF